MPKTIDSLSELRHSGINNLYTKIPERITVIDDDSITNLFCKLIIQQALGTNIEIRTFTKPQKALDTIEKEYSNRPVKTILFLDINMPVLNGWEVLEKLEGSEIDIKKYITVYMLSSSVDPRDRMRSEGSPLVKGFIEKPLDVPVVHRVCGIK